MAITNSVQHRPSLPKEAHQLCRACGFCCTGVLFADVRLQSARESHQLRQLGVPVQPGGRHGRLLQPCPCFTGACCAIYDHRPQRCRTFLCALVQKLISGRVSLDQALRIVQEARSVLQDLEAALAASGDRSPRLPLNRRIACALAQPVDLAARSSLATRQRLVRATIRLTSVLQRHFLTLPTANRSKQSLSIYSR